jgi:large subunit ribosomal protein L18
MNEHELKKVRRERRALSVRKRLRTDTDRPRLSVHRSVKNIAAQVIDDRAGRTLASASTLEKSVREMLEPNKKYTKSELSRLVGGVVAKRAIDKGITIVVFDRGSYRFHGRVKALAEAARGAGLKF